MRTNQLNFEEIQEEHLDTLIKLAFKQMDALETQELIAETAGDSNAQMDPVAESAYARFVEKLDAEQKEEDKRERIAAWKRRTPHIIEVAACVVLVLGIAAPFAVANVESLRSRVLNLLISFQSRYASLSFTENGQESFDVPAEWTGLYYLSYIPDGYSISRLSQLVARIELVDANGHEIRFEECDENDFVNIDTENAECSYEIINGSEALVVEKGKWTTVVWSREDRFFILKANESKELALELAASVRRITE